MGKKSHIYWYCQFIGWSFFVIINSIFFGLTYKYTYKDYLVYFLSLPLGIIITHTYRELVIKLKILEAKIPAQLASIVFFSIAKGIIFSLMINLSSLAFGIISIQYVTPIFVLSSILNFTVIFCLWNAFYFGFHYFQNYKRTEINSLRYLAASKESELKSLKAQLNPHFIFNCMNSIRALIDENPGNAKNAVTQLSNILRTTLLMDKSKEILLKDEINLVKDYLDLEKIRYEERLCFEFAINDDVLNCQIPPFIIQSQVENAIKHGISIVPGVGTIGIEAIKEGDFLKITVSNTGKLSSETPLTGVGFRNSIQRLELLYGEQAQIQINQVNEHVIVDITIPLKIK